MKAETVFKRVLQRAAGAALRRWRRRRDRIGERARARARREPDDGAQGRWRELERRDVIGEADGARVGRARPPRRTTSRGPKPSRQRRRSRSGSWSGCCASDRRPGTVINELELARAVRRRHQRDSRVPQPLQPLRPDREAAEFRLAVQGFYPGVRARALRDPRAVRDAFGDRLRDACRATRRPGRTLAGAGGRASSICSWRSTSRFHDFSDLDNRFHRLVNDASPNRFIVDFYDIISLIFHYHYQWNKRDERQRNEVALLEHLDYIEALFSRDPSRIEITCKSHLKSARKTLLASIEAAPPAARSGLKAGGSREAAADSFLTGRDEKPKQRWL